VNVNVLTCICLRRTCTKLHLSLTLLTKTRDVIASATDVYRVSRDSGRSFSKR